MNSRDTLTINENGVLQISGVDALSLVKKYNSPLYVFDIDYAEKVCKTFSDALSKNYCFGGFVSYASKAFCCKEIYRIISKYDLHADVVSLGELFTAKKAGFSFENLIFHGNNKSLDELEYAISNDIGLIVIDSYSEIEDIENICIRLNKKQKVLLRVNPGVEAHTHHYIQTAKVDSKFGFSISNGDACEVIKYIKTKNNISLSGLHCHIGSQIFEVNSFLLAVDKMTDFYKYCKVELSLEFDLLNLGGGFGIYYSEPDKKMSLKDYEFFVSSICERLIGCINSKKINPPKLILEPGRAIVGEAGVTLYKVGNVKKIKDVKNYISIDGGMFDNPRFALYQAKYSVDVANKMLADKTVKYSIAGKCCESGDLIAEDVLLPEVEKGDVLVVFSTGAYNYSMASNYNRNLIPPVIAVKNGCDKIIVKGQTLEDLIKNDN